MLIGNLTRDPEVRYTASGTSVCTIGLATNRQWTTESGEKKDEAEFHRLVAWAKLADICGQYLTKGRQIYVEGRLQTRKWQGQDGADKYTTEIVISDMVMLGNRGGSDSGDEYNVPDDFGEVGDQGAASTGSSEPGKSDDPKKSDQKASDAKPPKNNPGSPAAEPEEEDIPF